MYVDPIVEEIHQIRAKLFAECNHDLDRYLARMKASEAEHPERLVTLEEVRARAERSKASSGNTNGNQ